MLQKMNEQIEQLQAEMKQIWQIQVHFRGRDKTNKFQMVNYSEYTNYIPFCNFI